MQTKNSDKTVSVIMPCHNGADYLANSIQSVIDQTYKDWELLIVDDGSTDNSLQIIKEFAAADPRIRFFPIEKASGSPTYPRNVGIQNAVGRFIAFLDCDDMWLPEKLEHQLPLFENNKTAVVFSYYEKMDKDGVRDNRVVKSPQKVNFSLLLKGNCIGNLTGIYDTEKTGKIFQKDIRHEDYVMWLEILKSGWIARNTNSCEAVYREQKHSVSGNKFKVLGWVWNIYRNELSLSLVKSLYCFAFYVTKAFFKFCK